MTRVLLVLVLACAVSGTLVAFAFPRPRVGAPHDMTKPDGELDAEACGACHNEDMSLQRSKVETCTLCHLPSTHSGGLEHLRVDPARVEQALEGRAKDAIALPLAEDGRIWCGTCHLYHDPNVLEEKWLAQGWTPPAGGLSGAVRESVTERWRILADDADEKKMPAKFVAEGTRLLRAPVSDGTLCRQCHRVLP